MRDNEYMHLRSMILVYTLLLLFVFTGIACTTTSRQENLRGSAPAHPAAYSQDNFTFDKPRKERPDYNFDFYYKHCSVDEREPFPVGAIWQCTQP